MAKTAPFHGLAKKEKEKRFWLNLGTMKAWQNGKAIFTHTMPKYTSKAWISH